MSIYLNHTNVYFRSCSLLEKRLVKMNLVETITKALNKNIVRAEVKYFSKIVFLPKPFRIIMNEDFSNFPMILTFFCKNSVIPCTKYSFS